MVRAVQWIGAHGAQVFEMDLAQSTLQVLAHVQVDGELIRGEFAMSAKDSQNEGQNLINRRPESLKEKHQSNDSWDIRCSGVEPEGGV